MEETILRVNTTVNESDTGADGGTGLSLIEAVAIANNTPEDEIIELESEQIYEISSDLDIASTGGTLTIRGLGEGATIDANESDRLINFKLFIYKSDRNLFIVKKFTFSSFLFRLLYNAIKNYLRQKIWLFL